MLTGGRCRGRVNNRGHLAGCGCGCGSRVIGFRVRPDFFVTLLFPNESGEEKELSSRIGTSFGKKSFTFLYFSSRLRLQDPKLTRVSNIVDRLCFMIVKIHCGQQCSFLLTTMLIFSTTMFFFVDTIFVSVDNNVLF